MSCKKNKKRHPIPCPPARKRPKCCDEITLPTTGELTTTLTPILMLSTGDGFSPARALEIDATVSPTQTTVTPTTAQFQLQIDGDLIEPPVQIVLNDLDGPPQGEERSVTLHALVNVAAGAHVVTLLAKSDLPADVTPGDGGATLRVCTAAR